MLFFEDSSFTYSFIDYSELTHYHAKALTQAQKQAIQLKKHSYKVHALGASELCRIIARDPQITHYNFYLGEQQGTDAKSYQMLMYQNIYPKIDMVFYFENHQLKYDFRLKKGAKIKHIQLLYEGLDQIKLNKGALFLKTSVAQIVEEKPVSYRIKTKTHIPERVDYHLKGNRLTFSCDNTDKSTPLIIDPVLIFSSYSGSNSDNFGMTATYDSFGNLYAGGIAFSQGYPTTIGAFQTSYANSSFDDFTDVVISKYAADGSTLMYSTYLGGDGTETVHSMVADANDQLYIYGATSSSDFPTSSNAFDQSFNGGSGVDFASNGANFENGTDIFISKFNTNGTALLSSTYLGGSQNDGVSYNTPIETSFEDLVYNYGDQFRGEIILDNNQNPMITSATRSNDFPMVNGFEQSFQGVQDGIVVKMNPDLSAILWSTYLGGSNKDAGYSLKTDLANNVYVTGGTNSTDFHSSPNALHTNYQGGDADGFVIKINANGSSFINSTYIGTSSYDQSFFIEVDQFNNPYILGQSLGSMPVTPGVYSNSNSKQFIAKLNTNLSAFEFSSVFGNGNGSVNFSPSAFLVDQCNNIYISGWGGRLGSTQAMTGMPTTFDAFQANSPNGYDFYIAVFESGMQSLTYGSYFGGNQSDEHVDGGTSRFDKKGVVYQSVCAGCGGSSDFPTTPGVVSNTNNSSNCNNGTFKFDFENIVISSFTTSDTSFCGPTLVSLNNQSVGADQYIWDFGNGSTSTGTIDTSVWYTQPGTYTINLIAIDTTCDISDTTQSVISILDPLDYTPLNDTIICASDSIYLTAVDQNFSGTVEWSFNPQFSNPVIGPSFGFNVLQSTTLYIKITSGNCEELDTVTVFLEDFNFSYSTAPATCGACDGAAIISTTQPYTYQWDSNADNQNTSTAFNLCPGNYTVTLSTQNCDTAQTILVEDTADLALEITTNPANCFGDCDGSAQITHLGGDPPFSYIWSNTSTTQNPSNLCAGTHTVTITDANLCVAIRSIEIAEPAALTIASTSIDSIDCHNDCNGSIEIVISGGVPGYNMQWSNGSTNAQLSSLCAGVYNVSVTDNNNCMIDSSFTLLNPPLLDFSINYSEFICFNFCEGFAEFSVNGGTSPYTYSVGNFGSTSPEFDELCLGEYQVKVTDNNGCIQTDSIQISATNFDAFNLNLQANPDTIYEFTSSEISAAPEEPGTFSWINEGFQNPSDLSQIVSPNQTTDYIFRSYDTNDSLCYFDSVVTVHVIQYICNDPQIFVPNAFTPNGDNTNDILYVNGRLLTEFYFTIYNKWGEKIFESNDITNGWDGTYKNKEMDAGVFDYYLKAVCPNKEEAFLKGNITLIR